MRRNVLLHCLVWCWAVFSSPAGRAAEAPTEDASALFSRMQEAVDAIATYQCTFEGYTAAGQRSQQLVYHYTFSKPTRVRMELAAGPYTGTVLLYDNGGKVRAKVGSGPLSVFTFVLAPDSKYVCDLRGNGLPQSSWDYFISQHLGMARLISVTRLREERLDSQETTLFRLESADPARTLGLQRELLWIDNRNQLPAKFLQYDATGTLVQSARYTDVVLNPKLKSEYFTVFKP